MDIEQMAILVLLAISITLWTTQRQLIELLKDVLANRRKK